jgi:hypothetical protein
VADYEQANVVGFDGAALSGDAGILEIAGGLQAARGPTALDAALGMAAPFGIDAAFWPEAKLTGTYRPVERVALN